MAQYHPTRIVRPRTRGDRASAAERLLWSKLRLAHSDGFMFRRNQPIDGYVVDFFCARSRVAVELGVDRQTTRVGKYLEQKGYSVIRVGHTEAEEDPSGVAAQIVDLCKDLDPG